MVWFFLGGMICGVVGWNMFVKWAYKRIQEKRSRETPEDVMEDMLRAMRTRNFKSGEELLEYINSIKKRMDEAIERKEGNEAHE